jgi:hypothetical protein
MPPVLRTPNGLRQDPSQNGLNQPDEDEKLVAKEKESSREL